MGGHSGRSAERTYQLLILTEFSGVWAYSPLLAHLQPFTGLLEGIGKAQPRAIFLSRGLANWMGRIQAGAMKTLTSPVREYSA
jgi:hypothetical protein